MTTQYSLTLKYLSVFYFPMTSFIASSNVLAPLVNGVSLTLGRLPEQLLAL